MFNKKSTSVASTQSVVQQPKRSKLFFWKKNKVDTLAVPGAPAQHSSLFYQNVSKPSMIQKLKQKFSSKPQVSGTPVFSGKRVA